MCKCITSSVVRVSYETQLTIFGRLAGSRPFAVCCPRKQETILIILLLSSSLLKPLCPVPGITSSTFFTFVSFTSSASYHAPGPKNHRVYSGIFSTESKVLLQTTPDRVRRSRIPQQNKKKEFVSRQSSHVSPIHPFFLSPRSSPLIPDCTLWMPH